MPVIQCSKNMFLKREQAVREDFLTLESKVFYITQSV